MLNASYTGIAYKQYNLVYARPTGRHAAVKVLNQKLSACVTSNIIQDAKTNFGNNAGRKHVNRSENYFDFH